jgi:hypothetical protein
LAKRLGELISHPNPSLRFASNKSLYTTAWAVCVCVGGGAGHSKDTKSAVPKTLRLISQHKQGDDVHFENPSERREFMQVRCVDECHACSRRGAL